MNLFIYYCLGICYPLFLLLYKLNWEIFIVHCVEPDVLYVMCLVLITSILAGYNKVA